MSNKHYNHDTAPKFQKEAGWAPKANNTYSYGAKNGVGAGDRSGSPKDKRGSAGSKAGFDKTGKRDMTFQQAFRRKG